MLACESHQNNGMKLRLLNVKMQTFFTQFCDVIFGKEIWRCTENGFWCSLDNADNFFKIINKTGTY